MENTTATSTTPNTSALVTQGLPLFTQNQTLKSADLNAIVTNLKEQQLDRAQLIGVGILEGLNVSSQHTAQSPPIPGNTSVPKASIDVSAGKFVTGDGYYLTLDQSTALTFYQPLDQATSPFNESVDELFDVTSPNRLPLYQKTDRTVRTASEFKAKLTEHVLILMVEPKVQSRRALLSYDVIGAKQEITIRFFLVPNHLAGLKQQQARQQFISQIVAKPMLRRIGYHNADIHFSQLDSYQALKENYQEICKTAIASLIPALKQAKALPATFPKLATLIHQQDPTLKLNELFNQSSDYLSQTLNNLVSDTPGNAAGQPLMLQYFYDYLATIIAAYNELVAAVMAQSNFLVNTVSQDFLLLGPVTADEQSALSTDALAASRSQFTHVLPSPETQRQLDDLAALYLRLEALLKEGSFDVEALRASDDIILTSGGDRTQPLSQQSIPAYLDYTTIHPYWNHKVAQQQSVNTYRNDRAAALLHWPLSDNFYRLEGHLGQPARSVLTDVLAVRDRKNLAFEILLLKLPTDSNSSSTEQIGKEQLLHNFAQRYPAVDTLNGVSAGGTLILVYTETSSEESELSDTVVADFALPYRIEPESLRLQPPASFAISLQGTNRAEFRSNDSTRYKVLLEPTGGVITGKGLIEDSRELYFQPSSLADELTENATQKVTATLTARWGNYTKAITVSVLARPSAQFRLGDFPSGIDLEDAEISRDRFPLGIVPAVAGGRFIVRDGNDRTRNELLKGTPPQLLSLSPSDTIDSLTLIYTVESEAWGQQRSQLTIQLEAIPAPPEPSAKFKLGNFDSDFDMSTIEFKRDRFPLALVPETTDGAFEVQDSDGNPLEDWLQGTPPRLLTLPTESPLTSVTIQHTVSGNDNSELTSVMTIKIEPLPAPPPEPEELKLSIADGRVQFYKGDPGRYAITFTPEGGRVEGRGVVEEDGQYFFEPEQLSDDINEQTSVPIIGWGGGNGFKLLSVTVYSEPLSEFWLGDRASTLESTENETTVIVAPGTPSISLKPKIKEGSFRAFRRSRPSETLNEFIRGTAHKQTFKPSAQSESEPIIVQYTLRDESLWPREQRVSDISVIIQADEPEETKVEDSKPDKDESDKDESVDNQISNRGLSDGQPADVEDNSINVETLNSAIAQLSQENSGSVAFVFSDPVVPDPVVPEPEAKPLPNRTPSQILPFSSTLLPDKEERTPIALSRAIDSNLPSETKDSNLQTTTPAPSKEVQDELSEKSSEIPSETPVEPSTPGFFRRLVQALTKPIG